MKENGKHYVEKTKGYKVSLTLSTIFSILSLTAIVFGVLIPSLGWEVRLLWQIIIWFTGFVCLMFVLVFYTKQQLALRIGKLVDPRELKDLERNIEKYNFLGEKYEKSSKIRNKRFWKNW